MVMPNYRKNKKVLLHLFPSISLAHFITIASAPHSTFVFYCHQRTKVFRLTIQLPNFIISRMVIKIEMFIDILNFHTNYIYIYIYIFLTFLTWPAVGTKTLPDKYVFPKWK